MKKTEDRLIALFLAFSFLYIYTHLVIAFARGSLAWPF